MRGKQLVSIKGPRGIVSPDQRANGSTGLKLPRQANTQGKGYRNEQRKHERADRVRPAQKTKRRRKYEPNGLPGLQGHRDFDQ